MTDPLSITLGVVGVLPVIANVLKAYGCVRATFRTFRQFSREMKRLSTQLGVQKQLFSNHCDLLLISIINEKDIVTTMIDHYGDARWHDDDLEVQTRKRLRNNYDICRDVVEEIVSTLSKLEKELEVFDVLTGPRLDVNHTILCHSRIVTESI